MTGNEYQKLAYKTCNPENFQRMMVIPDCCASAQDFGDLMYSCFGLAGESGELIDLVKKVVFHAMVEPNLHEHLIKEAGDICWYLALFCHSIGVDFEEMMKTNIAKLKARYNGGGFDYDLANHKKENDI